MSDAGAPVAFHTGVADPVGHALRLTRKALSLGSRVLVLGDATVVRELDEQLWTADPGSFIPHARWSQAAAGAAALRHAPVWLMAGDGSEAGQGPQVPTLPSPLPDVLINLGLPVPVNADRFSKVIEVVSTEPEARAQGQQRWRHWREAGVNPAHHAFS